MAKLDFAAHDHRNPFAMRLLELRMGINIDNLDIGTQFIAYRPQRLQKVVAQMTPGAAVYRQSRALLTCHRSP